jgi:hypothetical protein
MPDYTGRFLDGWKNKVTIWAAANPHTFLIEDETKAKVDSYSTTCAMEALDTASYDSTKQTIL